MIDYSTPTIEQELIRLKAENARLRELLRVRGLDIEQLREAINSFESGCVCGEINARNCPVHGNEHKTREAK